MTMNLACRRKPGETQANYTVVQFFLRGLSLHELHYLWRYLVIVA